MCAWTKCYHIRIPSLRVWKLGQGCQCFHADEISRNLNGKLLFISCTFVPAQVHHHEHQLILIQNAGKPATSSCTTNFDNLGLILGSSSTLFNEACVDFSYDSLGTTLQSDLEVILNTAHEVTTSDLYAQYPNPFYNYKSSSATLNSANNVSAQENLAMVDGGEALQNNPLFPLLQPSRNVSVILVNDNSADISGTNFPNGSEVSPHSNASLEDVIDFEERETNSLPRFSPHTPKPSTTPVSPVCPTSHPSQHSSPRASTQTQHSSAVATLPSSQSSTCPMLYSAMPAVNQQTSWSTRKQRLWL